MWDAHERVVLGTGEGCTILALHGRGDAPERFRGLYDGMPLDATVIVPRAPEAMRPKAYSWFASSRDVSEEELGNQIGAQADRLAEAFDRAPLPMKKVVVTGFSQGGMLSFALAARHPERVKTALPLGGTLPRNLRPAAGTKKKTKIRAFHGEIDQVVPLAPTRETVTTLESQGWDATLTTYPGVGHTVPRAMQVDYLKALKSACEE